MLACRVCRVPLSAIAGCALCDPVRQNLVVVGESEEDRPALPEIGADLVRGLKGQVERVRALLKTDPDDLQAASRLIALANSAAKVIGEVRKLQDDGKKAVELMSFAEKAELFIGWFAGLAPAYRKSLSEKMADYEAKLAAPVPTEQALS